LLPYPQMRKFGVRSRECGSRDLRPPYLRRKDIKFTWVLEFQSRGAPHYHLIVSDFIHKYDLSQVWYRIVGSEDEKHLKAGTKIEAIKSKAHLCGYLSNYINKLDQKTPPTGFENVGRFWGASRNLLTFEMYQKIRWCQESFAHLFW
jgi:hypothetical protein